MLQHRRGPAGLIPRGLQLAGYRGIPRRCSDGAREVYPQPISFVCNSTGFDPINLRHELQNYQIVLQTSDSLPSILVKALKTDNPREVRLVPEGLTYVPQDNKSLFVEELAELLRQLYTHQITEVSFPFVLVVSVLTNQGRSPLLLVHCSHDANVVIGRRIKASAGANL